MNPSKTETLDTTNGITMRRDSAAPKARPVRGETVALEVCMAQGFDRALRAQIVALDHVRQVLPARYDDEAVHRLRVAVRRLFTLSRLLKRTGFPTPAPDLLRVVKKVRLQLGPARDVDCLFRSAGAAHDRLKPPAKLAESLEVYRRHLHADVRSRVVSMLDERFKIEADGWCAAVSAHVAALKSIPAGSVEPSICRRACKELERAYRRTRRRMASLHHDNRRALHEARIAVKELRYGVEALRDVLPVEATDPWCLALAHLQGELGHAHDADVAWDILKKLAVTDRDDAFLKTFNHQRHRIVAERSRTAWKAWTTIKKCNRPWSAPATLEDANSTRSLATSPRAGARRH